MISKGKSNRFFKRKLSPFYNQTPNKIPNIARIRPNVQNNLTISVSLNQVFQNGDEVVSLKITYDEIILPK